MLGMVCTITIKGIACIGLLKIDFNYSPKYLIEISFQAFHKVAFMYLQ